jgi:NADPH:quinone reductase-like Zn-dependent oxidoreductase
MPGTTSAVLTMRAAVIDRFGPPSVVRVDQVPRPEPGPGEMRVRVHAASVSVADHRMRSREVPRGMGLFVTPMLGLRRPRVPVLGMDLAGVVDTVGDGVAGFAPGDEVVALNGSRMGGHAQYAIVRAGGVVARKPPDLSFEDAAAVPFGGITAAAFLSAVTLGPGKDVLVNGASGAVGTWAVQLAARSGARVVGVCSGANADLLRSLGAAEVVDHTQADFTAGDARYDVLVECVGNVPFARLRRLVRPGGALLEVIMTSLGALLAAPWQTRRSGFRVIAGNPPKADGAMLADLLGRAASGELRPVIDSTYDLDDVVAAHSRVASGHKVGNVVLRIP